MIQRFIHSDAGGVILSIVWGFALAILFRRICTSRECITVYGPKPEDVRDKIMKWNQTCYKIEPRESSCEDPDTEIVRVRS